MPVLYHRSRHPEAILCSGFRGGSGRYLTEVYLEDVVWLSGAPDDGDQEVADGVVIAVEVPAAVDLDQFEVVEEGNPRREWAVPAELVNRWPRRKLLDE